MGFIVTAVDPADFAWDSALGASVRDILAAARHEDGRDALNEQALLRLRHSGLADAALWLAVAEGTGTPIGLALTDRRSGKTGVETDLVVTPEARRAGAGGALAEQVRLTFPGADVSAWSHGNHPAAQALASRAGLSRVRELWLMRRSLSEPLPEVRTPEGVVVRTFEVGRDEEPFLAVNAEAFADHPEQGDLTRADLEERKAEPWFDPAGFFLAERDGDVLGFHWTKVHPAGPDRSGDAAHGEVYVVGIASRAQGRGLGRTLTLTGLHHLRALGLGEVVLYVEADNAAAVAVYRGLGFTHAEADTDVMYAGTAGDQPLSG